jgi:hypothetical protein
VSQSILNEIKHCTIKPTTQNKLFDHKAVSLDLRKKDKIITVPTVARFILKDPELEVLVALTVIEYYVLHTTTLVNQEKTRILGIIGTAKSDFRKIGPSSVHINVGSRSELEDLERERILGGIRDFVDGFPLQDLQRGDLREDVSDDFFLEGLINNIRNETISHQIFISNSLKKSRLELTEKIKQLKLNYNENIDEIIEREIELSKKIEDEARTELENNENFEYLNHEKITPYFVKLAKGSKSEAEMDDICDSDGNPFNSATDRKKFIVDFYANLYKKEPGEPESLAGCIEQFLGAEICNNKIVKESKIPANLARELDLPISLTELDESVKQGNKSAAGMDGLSNCFIKKFWRFLRIPVHRYTTYCINNGSLTHTFRTAKIKITTTLLG